MARRRRTNSTDRPRLFPRRDSHTSTETDAPPATQDEILQQLRAAIAKRDADPSTAERELQAILCRDFSVARVSFALRTGLVGDDTTIGEALERLVEDQLGRVQRKVARYVKALTAKPWRLSRLQIWADFGENGQWPSVRVVGGLRDFASGESDFKIAKAYLDDAQKDQRFSRDVKAREQHRAQPRGREHKWQVATLCQAIEQWAADRPGRDVGQLTNFREDTTWQKKVSRAAAQQDRRASREGSERRASRDGSERRASREGSEGHPSREGSEGHPSREGSEGHPSREGSERRASREGSEASDSGGQDRPALREDSDARALEQVSEKPNAQVAVASEQDSEHHDPQNATTESAGNATTENDNTATTHGVGESEQDDVQASHAMPQARRAELVDRNHGGALQQLIPHEDQQSQRHAPESIVEQTAEKSVEQGRNAERALDDISEGQFEEEISDAHWEQTLNDVSAVADVVNQSFHPADAAAADDEDDGLGDFVLQPADLESEPREVPRAPSVIGASHATTTTAPAAPRCHFAFPLASSHLPSPAHQRQSPLPPSSSPEPSRPTRSRPYTMAESVPAPFPKRARRLAKASLDITELSQQRWLDLFTLSRPAPTLHCRTDEPPVDALVHRGHDQAVVVRKRTSASGVVQRSLQIIVTDKQPELLVQTQHEKQFWEQEVHFDGDVKLRTVHTTGEAIDTTTATAILAAYTLCGYSDVPEIECPRVWQYIISFCCGPDPLKCRPSLDGLVSSPPVPLLPLSSNSEVPFTFTSISQTIADLQAFTMRLEAVCQEARRMRDLINAAVKPPADPDDSEQDISEQDLTGQDIAELESAIAATQAQLHTMSNSKSKVYLMQLAHLKNQKADLAAAQASQADQHVLRLREHFRAVLASLAEDCRSGIDQTKATLVGYVLNLQDFVDALKAQIEETGKEDKRP